MKVEFYKTGERMYAIKILRDNLPDLEMNPAPGFDDLMPHDMCHLIVEQVLQIKQGIFGQIANGGTAGSFRTPQNESAHSKNDSRQRRKNKQKGEKLVKQNLDDLAKSERATYICWQHWISHSSDKKLKLKATEMKENADSIFAQTDSAERAVYSKENLAKVRLRMNQISEEWQQLKIGETMIVTW